MLANLCVVLVRPRFPENIGAAARACLNFGCENLVLVEPENFDLDKALPLATAHAKPILTQARLAPDLPTALAGVTRAFGATARTGGWRKGIMLPDTAGSAAAGELALGGRVALVFGPEDKGLANEETRILNGLVTIPTTRGNSSLNLAQAVVVLLYECFTASLKNPFTPKGPPEERPTTVEEQETLFKNLRETLLAVNYLKADNPDYWMLPVRRFFARFRLKRNEFNLLMGICRQVRWIAGKAREAAPDAEFPSPPQGLG